MTEVTCFRNEALDESHERDAPCDSVFLRRPGRD